MSFKFKYFINFTVWFDIARQLDQILILVHARISNVIKKMLVMIGFS